MRLLTIKDSDDAKLLRRPAKRVRNVQSTEVILGIQEMRRVAHAWEQETGHRCEGIAGPQLGWNARVMLLRKSDEMMPRNPDKIPNNTTVFKTEQDYLDACKFYKEWMRAKGSCYNPWMVLINPVVVKEEGSQDSVEACLSVPGSAYKVRRPETVIFKFTHANGTFSGHHMARTRSAEEIPGGDNSAVRFMHELDHLRGLLIDETATEAYVGVSEGELL